MSNVISKEDVDKVSKLARVDTTEQEQEKFARDLSGILDNFKDLSDLDVSDVQKVDFLATDENQTRSDDVIELQENQKEAIRSQFPQRENDYLKVKAVL